MRPLWRWIAPLALFSMGCDDGVLVIVPEVDEQFSFESGLDGWTPRAVDSGGMPPVWSIGRSDEGAVAGGYALRLQLANRTDAGRIWVERAFEVADDQSYVVSIQYMLGTSDFDGTPAWKLISGAHLTPPSGAGDLILQGDTGAGAPADESLNWVERGFEMTAVSDTVGVLYVAIGISGEGEGDRSYLLDSLQVQFTRQR